MYYFCTVASHSYYRQLWIDARPFVLAGTASGLDLLVVCLCFLACVGPISILNIVDLTYV